PKVVVPRPQSASRCTRTCVLGWHRRLRETVVVEKPCSARWDAWGTRIRCGTTATLCDDGHILIAGGTVGDLISADLELFDPVAGASVLGGAMAQPRTGHAAAKLADGKGLIVGGTNR